jgi:uncharacterized protein (TIGR04255 family)
MIQPREIYPSPAVQFVIFELRYPTALFLDKPDGREAIYERLSEAFPLLQTVNTVQLPFSTGGGAIGASLAGLPSAGSAIRMLNRDRSRSATLGPTSLQMEISIYEGFEDFAASIRQVLQAIAEVGIVQGVERLSLRYIDEIRILGVEDAAGWAAYIDERLLGPGLFPAFRAHATDATAQYELGDGLSLQLRAAAMPADAQPAVSPAGPLRLRHSGSGPYFLLDTTGAWTLTSGEVPRFIVDDVLQLSERLHDPLHQLFEQSITERLRDEVLRRESHE